MILIIYVNPLKRFFSFHLFKNKKRQILEKDKFDHILNNVLLFKKLL